MEFLLIYYGPTEDVICNYYLIIVDLIKYETNALTIKQVYIQYTDHIQHTPNTHPIYMNHTPNIQNAQSQIYAQYNSHDIIKIRINKL